MAHEKLTKVKKAVKANMRNEQNPDGLLTREERAYMNCLELQERELEELFEEDEAYWTENFDNAKNSLN